jgi:HSP20 family molecular chaperone IbpA
VGTFTDAPPKIWKRGGPWRACGAAAGRHGGTGGLGWAGLPGRTYHTRAQAEALLRALVVERFEEVEEDGRTAVGQPKHWHLFHVVARMPGAEPGALDVRVERGVLTLLGRTQALATGAPLHREYELTGFFRQFQLPEESDPGRIAAQLTQGVLTLRQPRAAPAAPRRIEVRTA